MNTYDNRLHNHLRWTQEGVNHLAFWSIVFERWETRCGHRFESDTLPGAHGEDFITCMVCAIWQRAHLRSER